MAIVANGSINAGVLLDVPRGSRVSCSDPRWRSSSRRTRSAADRAAACAACSTSPGSRACSCCSGRSITSRSRARPRAALDVFRGGFLVRRLRHAARDRRGGAPEVRRRAHPGDPAPALDRAPFLQHLPLALPDLLRDPPGPRRADPRLAAAHAAHGADAGRGRALVPLRRDADPRAARSAATCRGCAPRTARAGGASRDSAGVVALASTVGGARARRGSRQRAGRDAEHPRPRPKHADDQGPRRRRAHHQPDSQADTRGPSGASGATGTDRRHRQHGNIGPDRVDAVRTVTTTRAAIRCRRRPSRSATR